MTDQIHPSDGDVKTNVLRNGIIEHWEYVEHEDYEVRSGATHGHWKLTKIEHPDGI